MLIVQKFGGSSLAGAERLRRAASIIADSADAWNKVVAVVSARGDTTDELLGQARRISADPPVRELDALLSCGETGSAAMTAMQLADMGKSCVSLTGAQAGILTDSVHGAARILSIDTARIMRELDAGKIVVAAGFQGAERGGDTTTLGPATQRLSAAAARTRRQWSLPPP
ncbi:aspartokinase [Firmicutes bacterium CAG:240]|nr:aspartokinase [Firmicutes bacterium CAG:240]